MNAIERIEKQKVLIEELGRYFDKEGFQPISGRILALLMVMDKEQYTFDEIVEELQISKSSASNALKQLEIRGYIEYVTLPGDRKRYFQVKIQDSFSMLGEFEKKFKGLQKVLTTVVELKADKNSRNCKFINEMNKMLDYFVQQLKSIISNYNK